MLHYWFTIGRMLAARYTRPRVRFDATIRRRFRVRLFDCDGLRVMTAAKYPMYMDFIRWEMIARSELFTAIVKRGLAPTLGSQKLIYRKPLKVWTTFDVELQLAGYDDRWIYHIHRFVQHGELRALGVTRALIWKRDVPTALDELLRAVGATGPMPPPAWVLALFAADRDLLEQEGAAGSTRHAPVGVS
jgi:acyl-CoA thioesterase FadM